MLKIKKCTIGKKKILFFFHFLHAMCNFLYNVYIIYYTVLSFSDVTGDWNINTLVMTLTFELTVYENVTLFYRLYIYIYIYKGKVIPLQARCGPEGG